MSMFLHKFFYVLQGKYKVLLFMLLLFLFTSIMEVIGIGMIGPFIALATNPNAIKQNRWLHSTYTYFHLSSTSQFLMLIGLVVVSIFYLKSFLSFSAQRYIFKFGFSQQGELAARLMNAYLKAPYTFHLTRNSAVIIKNLISETDRFSNGLVMPLLTSVSNSIVILMLVLLLIKTNALAIVIIGGILLCAFSLFHYLKDKLKQWGKDVSKSRAEIIRLINQSLGGLKETRVIGCESYFEEQLQVQVKKYGETAALGTSFANLPRYLIEALLITFLIIFTLISTAIEPKNPQDLSSVLGIFALASIRLLPATSNLLSAINGIKYNTHSLNQIYLDLQELEQVNALKTFNSSHDSSSQLNSSNKSICFTDVVVLDTVVYRYSDELKNALQGICLELKRGQSIGIIGKSGAGKTTLIDVILGLLIPQSGDIKVDGVSIYTDLRSWQNMIGYVPQSIFLIDDTLERNIAFGVPDHLIDRERVCRVVQAAQLSDLVEQLPQGLQTAVGERGVLLSGGQRQRVGIARALYHEREILVFDEATAALDNETESLVTEAIQSLSGMKTMIIIAHRLSTIEHCDRIYMMEGGRVVKSGSYQEVVLSK